MTSCNVFGTGYRSNKATPRQRRTPTWRLGMPDGSDTNVNDPPIVNASNRLGAPARRRARLSHS